MERLEEAAKSLDLMLVHREKLVTLAETSSVKKISKADADKLIEALFSTAKSNSTRATTMLTSRREDFMTRLTAPDLANFKDTQWAWIQAVLDHAQHRPAQRETSGIEENRFRDFLDGDKWQEMALEAVMAVA
jgi:hypothetical protein